MTEDRKFCGGCGQWKPRSEFGTYRSNKDGLRNRCMCCAREARKRQRDQRRLSGPKEPSREHAKALLVNRPPVTVVEGIPKPCPQCGNRFWSRNHDGDLDCPICGTVVYLS